MNHLPVLLIVVPLMSAPLCVLIRQRKLVLGFGLAVAWSCFAMATSLLLRVLREGTVSYALGNWPAPYGIEYRVDPLNAFVLLFVSALGAIRGRSTTCS